MSLFTIDAPQPASPRPPVTPRHGRGWVVVLLVTALIVLGAGGLAVWRVATASSAPTLTAAATLALPAAVRAGACIDSSGSVIDTDDAPRRALAAVSRELQAWPSLNGPVKRTVFSAPQAELGLVIQVVQDNSYATGADTSRVEVRISAYPGLSGEPPATNDPHYAVNAAAYDRLVKGARAAHDEQVMQADRAAAALGALESRRSKGSDILGCVAALGESASPQEILVVSDLADTRLTEPDGSDRTFEASLAHTNLTIVQSCPSGSPKRCTEALRAFESGLQRMGLTQPITLARSEETSDQVSTWIGDLRRTSMVVPE